MSGLWLDFRQYMKWPARVVVIPAAVGLCTLLECFFLYATTSGEFCAYDMAMDMKMEGFKTIWVDRESTSCITLFNSAWILRTKREFLLAFAMIMLVAAFSEALGYERRTLRAAAVAAGGRRGLSGRDRALVALAFAVHVTLGYLLMLCAMTYQVEFLFAVSGGLGLGHFVFNAEASPAERADPCCGDGAGGAGASEKSPLVLA